MTIESEAQKRWCPFARTYDSDQLGGAVATNRPLQYGDTARGTDINCIASRCMAWRWATAPSTGRPTKQGFCGLAGKPEANL